MNEERIKKVILKVYIETAKAFTNGLAKEIAVIIEKNGDCRKTGLIKFGKKVKHDGILEVRIKSWNSEIYDDDPGLWLKETTEIAKKLANEKVKEILEKLNKRRCL